MAYLDQSLATVEYICHAQWYMELEEFYVYCYQAGQRHNFDKGYFQSKFEIFKQNPLRLFTSMDFLTRDNAVIGIIEWAEKYSVDKTNWRHYDSAKLMDDRSDYKRSGINGWHEFNTWQ